MVSSIYTEVAREDNQDKEAAREDKEAAKEDKEAAREQFTEEKEDEKVEELEDDEPMSALRKVAFIASIVFSVVLCVVFLWGLPCDLATCLAPTTTNSTETFTSARPRSTEM